jgi:hypothetical protein
MTAVWVAFGGCSDSTSYTFNKDIAPILAENCISCHRSGGAAPFAFSTYQEVFRKKKTIASVIQSGYMPPWPADKSYTSFLDQKGLTPKEIKTIVSWVEQGAPEGEESLSVDLVAEERPHPLGEPDLRLALKPIAIRGNNRDRFLVVKVPLELDQDTFVRAVEFEPGPNYLVHHMNGHLLNYPSDNKSDVFDGKRVIEVEQPRASYLVDFDSLKLYNDDGTKPQRIHSAVNYLPGAEPTMYPSGIGGFRMNRKAAFVANDIHYGPVPKDYVDSSYINVYFDSVPPKRPIYEFMMGTNGVAPVQPPLYIPANTVKKFRSVLQIPEDISILTINPHMHLLGKSFLAYALTPGQDTIRLIHIPKWNFRWQYFYTFTKMVKIPAGSRVIVEATFDNTSKNPDNPNQPPQDVSERLDRGGEGMRTTDEMLQFIVTYLPYQSGDEDVSLKPD